MRATSALSRLCLLLAIAACGCGRQPHAPATFPPPGQTTELISITPAGKPSNDTSWDLSLSADGRCVAFWSAASDLVPDDTNDVEDVFLRDRRAGTTERLSVNDRGLQANGFSAGPRITPDGRFVVFWSGASNLVPGDKNDKVDVFLRDRLARRTELISISSLRRPGNDHSAAPAISASGRFVAFSSAASSLVEGDTNRASDIFLRDRKLRTTARISLGDRGQQANGESNWPTISASGRFVAFESAASNLVPGDTNRSFDVFLWDRQTRKIERISLNSKGEQGKAGSFLPLISADGRCVAFHSAAANLVPDDTNQAFDVFLRDRRARRTERVSVSAAGAQGNGNSKWPSISADGRFVAFCSRASNLVPGDTNDAYDIFLRDRPKRSTARISLGPAGRQANDSSWAPTLSRDGRLVGFKSDASNLLAGNPTSRAQLYLRHRGPGAAPLWAPAQG